MHTGAPPKNDSKSNLLQFPWKLNSPQFWMVQVSYLQKILFGEKTRFFFNGLWASRDVYNF